MMYYSQFLLCGSVIFAFRQSHLPGKVVVLLLFAGSIFAWSTMLTKFVELHRARVDSRRFVKLFRAERNPLSLYVKGKAFAASPLYRVFEGGSEVLHKALSLRGKQDDLLSSGRITESELDRVKRRVARGLADEGLWLEGRMGFLATAVTAAPFLGLLGTVWGVMDSFGRMAAARSTTLWTVAPGISGALLTTVVGLLVALPSAIGYNMLSTQIRRLAVEMEDFAEEFTASADALFVDHG